MTKITEGAPDNEIRYDLTGRYIRSCDLYGRIAGHKLSFFFWRNCLEPAEEAEGQMRREHIGPPKKQVCDGPQMKCPREQLHKNDPVQFLAFLFLSRFLSEAYGTEFYLGTLPRNTLPENLQKSLGKGKEPSWNRKKMIQDRPAHSA